MKVKAKQINLKYESLMGIKISSDARATLLDECKNKLKSGNRFFVVTPNPEIIVASQSDLVLQNILNSAEISLSDGVGIRYAQQILSLRKTERIPGREFMFDLIKVCSELNKNVYFLGGNTVVNKEAIERVKKSFPNLVIYGESNLKVNKDGEPINNIELIKERKIILDINRKKIDMIFIAFGCPKQEKWWYRQKDNIQVTGGMVVGGSLDYYSGYKRIPPSIISNIGMEWLWRFIQEPKRVVRILNATVVFPLLLLKTLLYRK